MVIFDLNIVINKVYFFIRFSFSWLGFYFLMFTIFLKKNVNVIVNIRFFFLI